MNVSKNIRSVMIAACLVVYSNTDERCINGSLKGAAKLENGKPVKIYYYILNRKMRGIARFGR